MTLRKPGETWKFSSIASEVVSQTFFYSKVLSKHVANLQENTLAEYLKSYFDMMLSCKCTIYFRNVPFKEHLILTACVATWFNKRCFESSIKYEYYFLWSDSFNIYNDYWEAPRHFLMCLISLGEQYRQQICLIYIIHASNMLKRSFWSSLNLQRFCCIFNIFFHAFNL